MKDGRWTKQYRIPSSTSPTGWAVTLQRDVAVEVYESGQPVMVRDVKVWDSDWRRPARIRPQSEWQEYRKQGGQGE